MGDVSIDSSRLLPWTMLNETSCPSLALLVVASGWSCVLFSKMTLNDEQEPRLKVIGVHASIVANQEASFLIEAEWCSNKKHSFRQNAGHSSLWILPALHGMIVRKPLFVL